MKKMLLVLLFFVCVYTYAQQKYALVIGNEDYIGISKLRNPVNDANDIAEVLSSLGFIVETVINGNLDQMETAAMELKRRLSASSDSYGFFFYAGHGVQSSGENYLIPVDASNILSDSHLRQRALCVQTLLDNLNEARNELNMIVLDACRDNPFSWARSAGRGLTTLSSSPPGSIIMFATSANSSAADGLGRNGLFTSHLLQNLRTPGLSVRDIFDKTGSDVLRASGGTQHPELSIKYFGASTAYLGPRPAGSASTVQTAPQSGPIPVPRAGPISAELFGAWVNNNTIIVFSSDSISVSWPESDGVTVGYTISPSSCTAVNNTSGRNLGYRYGYRIIGKIVHTTVPSVDLGSDVDRSYFFDAYKQSIWNSGSSTYVIYYKQ